MTYIVYSQINEKKLSNSLGKPDYSYYFVLKGFLPVLKDLGRVIVVNDPEKDVDRIYNESRNRGEECVFITFSPPNKSAVGLQCPTICVLAWEFDRIPDEVWEENPKNDWRYVFADHGRTITLSKYSTEAVKKTMGANFPVVSIPVPVWDGFATYHMRYTHPFPAEKTELAIDGNIVDSRQYVLTSDAISLIEPLETFQLQSWSGETLHLHCGLIDRFNAYLGGFYEPEPWGAWSRTQEPWVLLPYLLSGEVHFKISARGYGANIGKEICVSLGDEKQHISMTQEFSEMPANFRLKQPAHVIKFSGLDLAPVPNSSDPRTMGIGLRSIEISGKADPKLYSATDAQCNTSYQLFLDGIVYTSVLNPFDDRKNWREMVKAFCAAFQHTKDATLVLKMTHHSVTSFLGKWHYLLQQLGSFECRVVILHGYLKDDAYEKLIAATHFYVNTSRCEGLCLPLMEFMACGKPAIAPCHTSLADYVDASSTFIVNSNFEPTIWPHDPRELLRTLCYRIDFESLMNAYRQSYSIAKNQSSTYKTMASAAASKIKAYASQHVVREQLREFFTKAPVQHPVDAKKKSGA